MITYLFKKAVEDRLAVLATYKKGAWVHVEEPTNKEITDLAKRFKLDVSDLEDVLDEDEMPRLEQDGAITYLYARHVYQGQEHEPSTSPLLLVSGPDFFMTIAYRTLPRFDKFMNSKLEFTTTSASRLLLLILEEIVDEYDVFLNRVSRKIQIIRSRLRSQSVEKGDFIDFVLIEDELNEFLSVLQPLSVLLRRLRNGRHVIMLEEEADLVDDLLLNTEQSIEACKSTMKTIVNIREAYSTIAGNELNRTMKVLTIATVLIALPNVFFGMYGMNVSLPFGDAPFSYFIVVGVTLLVMLATIFIARAKKII